MKFHIDKQITVGNHC